MKKEKIYLLSEWQLCPKCMGQGIVSKPNYAAGDLGSWTSSSVSFTCDVCFGAKILAKPILKPENKET